MKLSKLLLICAGLCLVMLSSVSCSKNNKIVFDDSDSTALELDNEWAVVTFRYVSFRVKPGFEEDIASQGRIGDILLVKGKKFVSNLYDSSDTLWYKFDKGWLNENNVTLYSNKLKAKSAAKKLINLNEEKE